MASELYFPGKCSLHIRTSLPTPLLPSLPPPTPQSAQTLPKICRIYPWTIKFVGLSNRRTIEPSVYRNVGLSNCRTIELSDYRTVGQSNRRTKELSDHHYAPFYNTWNSKTRQMPKIQYWHQQITVSMSTLAFNVHFNISLSTCHNVVLVVSYKFLSDH